MAKNSISVQELRHFYGFFHLFAGGMTELPRGFDARGSWRAGRPPDLFGGSKAVPERKFPTSAGRGQGGGGYSSFRKGLMLGGAGGPDALQTSSPVRKLDRVASFSARGPAGLTCRASPANSSIAGAAPLDSVRLRRNRSLLLCETQSSSLTCARGADRALRCAGQAGREALAAQDAYPVRKQTITEKLSVLTVPAQSKRPECAQFSGRYRFFKCLLSKCAQFSGRYR